MDFESIKLLVLDVDGVLTCGDVTFDEREQRVMSFSIHDGWAIKLWRRAGRRAAIISGRSSPIVERRAAELGIAPVYQEVEDKAVAWDDMLGELNLTDCEACYVGDDLPDIALLSRAGFAVAVANAVPVVKRSADYVTSRSGGEGAVAEIIEYILRKQGAWTTPIRSANA